MKPLSTVCLMMFLLASCEDKLAILPGCCEDNAIYAEFGDGGIFIPNVFTPNADGLNDQLYITGDSVAEIDELKIRSMEGIIVYHMANIPINGSSWDGTINGLVVAGMYDFELEATSYQGYKEKIEGNICVFPCGGVMDKDFVPIKNCSFAEFDTNYFHQPLLEGLPCFDH